MRRQRRRRPECSGRRWRRRRHGGCCGEGGSSVGLQVRIGAEHGVVISHEFGQQIFLKDVRPAVHIHLAAQLQQLTHLHFAEDWQHCSLFGRVALHSHRWVAGSTGVEPRRVALHCRRRFNWCPVRVARNYSIVD